MSLAKEAYASLFPGQQPEKELKVRYSGRFRGYNAGVRYSPGFMEFSLSRNWKDVDTQIKEGLIQTLILKAMGKKASTIQIELYNIFLKKVHQTTPKTRIDPALREIFLQLNERYFGNLLEMPNLVWGRHSLRKLGSYDYGRDTVILSRALFGNTKLASFVLYHELLHKKHKFTTDGRGSLHHSRAFKTDELKYERHSEAESELAGFLRRKRVIGLFRW